MAELNIVSSSPHIRSNETTDKIMRDVVIALIPATLVGFYVFGLNAIITVLLTIGSALLFEWLYNKLMHRPTTLGDYSALVTGLLLGLNLPQGNFTGDAKVILLSIAVPVLGSLFAIIVVKQLFGGLGANFMNPALGARAFLLVSFAKHMTTWQPVDTVTGATVLTYLKNGETPEFSLLHTFLGVIPGSIGEVSALALLIGGIYLIVRKVISYRIPVFFIGTVIVMLILMSGKGFDLEFIGYHVCSGGLMIGAFFMATDYVTSPMTAKGQIIFAIGCGIITSLIRMFGSYPEGVSFAIIIMNLFVPLIDRYTIPKAFGEVK